MPLNAKSFVRIQNGRYVILTEACIGKPMAETSEGDVMTWEAWAALPVAR